VYKSYFDPVSGVFWGSSKSNIVKPKWADAVMVEGRFGSDYRINDFDNLMPELIPDDEILVKSREEITYCYKGDPIQKVGDRWEGIMHLPVKTSDGLVFDFNEESWQVMKQTVAKFDFLESEGNTSHRNWKLAGDQGFVQVTKAQLEDYLDQCEQQRALKVAKAYPEYLTFKGQFDAGSPPKIMDLDNWKRSYLVA